MNMGDVVERSRYQIRPFEVNAGETDRVLDQVTNEMQRSAQAQVAMDGGKSSAN